MFNSFAKSTAAVAIFSTALLSANAAAAPWTITTTGTISWGYDYSGSFGAVTNDLGGKFYSMTTIIDPDLYVNQSEESFGDGYGVREAGGVLRGGFTQIVTIGGVRKVYQVEPSGPTGHATLYSTPNHRYIDQYFGGMAATGEEVSGYHSVSSVTHKFFTSLSYSQTLSFAPHEWLDSAYASFNQSGHHGGVYFDARPLNLYINVPEPAPLALFGLGVLALAVARRKAA